MVIDFENIAYTPFHNACEGNDITKVKTLLKEGYSIDEINKNRTTGLMLAASGGHTKLVKKLLLYGANPDIINSKGNKAINYSTDEEIINILSKPRIYLQVKALYDQETNIYHIEIWYIYKKCHSQSYTFEVFETLFDELFNIFPQELPILMYNGVRLTPFNFSILAKTNYVFSEKTAVVTSKPTKKLPPRICGCLDLC